MWVAWLIYTIQKSIICMILFKVQDHQQSLWLEKIFLSTAKTFVNWDLFYSGAANNHVAAFFQDRPIFVSSDNLGYSLSKDTWYPNLWPPCGGIWLNSIILSFMGKYSSWGLVFFHLWPISFELKHQCQSIVFL